MVRFQIGDGDRPGFLAVDCDLGVEPLQRLEGQRTKCRLERRSDLGMALQYRLTDDRGRGVDDLRAFIVLEGNEPERRDRAVCAVGHRGIDA